MDIGAVRAGVSGDPVYAAYDGKVVIAHRQSEYYSTAGNYVMIYHMGNTGNSFGAHLHFDVMLDDGKTRQYVNPMPYFNK